MALSVDSRWKPADLIALVSDVLIAAESGAVDAAFDGVVLISGHLSRTKNPKNITKDFVMACLQTGVRGISAETYDKALDLANSYRVMNADARPTN